MDFISHYMQSKLIGMVLCTAFLADIYVQVVQGDKIIASDRFHKSPHAIDSEEPLGYQLQAREDDRLL